MRDRDGDGLVGESRQRKMPAKRVTVQNVAKRAQVYGLDRPCTGGLTQYCWPSPKSVWPSPRRQPTGAKLKDVFKQNRSRDPDSKRAWRQRSQASGPGLWGHADGLEAGSDGCKGLSPSSVFADHPTWAQRSETTVLLSLITLGFQTLTLIA